MNIWREMSLLVFAGAKANSKRFLKVKVIDDLYMISCGHVYFKVTLYLGLD